jgi:PKD repeat protein
MDKRDWIGIASRLFNEHVAALDTLAPHNALSSSGTYCLADPGREYVVYSKIGSSTTFDLDMSADTGGFNCRFYDPRDGQFEPVFVRPGGGVQSFTLPSSDDWVLHVVEQPNEPVAVIDAQPTAGESPLLVSLNGSGSYDPDGGSIVSYEWDFQDDGTVDATGPIISQDFRGNVSWVVRLTVTDNDSRTGDSTVVIAVTTPPDRAPGDFDGDDDVDQEDFGHIQVCLSGSGEPQTDPSCPDADLDADGDVDQNDYTVFEGCITGANTAADPGCATG